MSSAAVHLYVLVGPSCSGKTTWAKAYSISNGAKHLELDRYQGDGRWQRHAYVEAQCDSIEWLVSHKNKDVILDSTALGKEWRKAALEAGRVTGRKRVAVAFRAPLHTLEWRNKHRENPRAPDLLRSMHWQSERVLAELYREPWDAITEATWCNGVAALDTNLDDGQRPLCDADGYPVAADW